MESNISSTSAICPVDVENVRLRLLLAEAGAANREGIGLVLLALPILHECDSAIEQRNLATTPRLRASVSSRFPLSGRLRERVCDGGGGIVLAKLPYESVIRKAQVMCPLHVEDLPVDLAMLFSTPNTTTESPSTRHSSTTRLTRRLAKTSRKYRAMPSWP